MRFLSALVLLASAWGSSLEQWPASCVQKAEHQSLALKAGAETALNIAIELTSNTHDVWLRVEAGRSDYWEWDPARLPEQPILHAAEQRTTNVRVWARLRQEMYLNAFNLSASVLLPVVEVKVATSKQGSPLRVFRSLGNETIRFELNQPSEWIRYLVSTVIVLVVCSSIYWYSANRVSQTFKGLFRTQETHLSLTSWQQLIRDSTLVWRRKRTVHWLRQILWWME